MAVRYDDAEHTLTCSVRDLVEAGAPSGHLSLAVVQRRAARAAAGRRVHTEWQAERLAEASTYRAEVALKRQLVVGDWTCVVQGRVDGLQEEAGHTVVEEVKSTALDASRLYGSQLTDWPSHVAQLEIYLWMLAEAGFQAPVGRLVLVSIADGSRHVLGVALEQDRIHDTIVVRLTELVEARERRLAWLDGRRGQTVPIPHTSWRPGQREIAEATEWGLEAGQQILVEAPTGLGKTSAAIVGVLKHALATDKQVFWATARTTQQDGPVRTLGMLAEAGLPLRSVVITAKDKVCLNEVVSCRPDACPYAEGYYDKLKDDGLVTRLTSFGGHLGAERLRDAGQDHRVCPFELALDLSSHVDVVVGDYNYVFDPSVHIRRHFADDAAKGWVVVVDEVHQLADRARSYWSPQVEVRVAREALGALWTAGAAFGAFVSLAQRIEDAILSEVRRASGRSAGDLRVAEPDLQCWRRLADEVDAVGLDYALLRADTPQWTSADDPWLTCARQVLRFSSVLEEAGEETVPVVRHAVGVEHVGLRCLDPSPRLGPKLARLGGFVGLSATLSPPQFHRDLLGLVEDRLEVVQVPSPFPPERRKVMVAPRVSTAFSDRAQHAPATARLLQSCIEAVPGNVAAYFPSFAMLDDIVDRWDLADRDLLIQEPGMDDAARAAFIDRLGAGGPPVVLAAVLGGIYAEGIDLPAGALSAVMVAGPALPPIGLERDLLKEYFEAKYGKGFLYASLVPGTTRVVQAAGRLIRRTQDRGVVLLVGRRFRWRDIASLLPEAWHAEVAQDPASEVAAFFA